MPPLLHTSVTGSGSDSKSLGDFQISSSAVDASARLSSLNAVSVAVLGQFFRLTVGGPDLHPYRQVLPFGVGRITGRGPLLWGRLRAFRRFISFRGHLHDRSPVLSAPRPKSRRAITLFWMMALRLNRSVVCVSAASSARGRRPEKADANNDEDEDAQEQHGGNEIRVTQPRVRGSEPEPLNPRRYG